MSRPGTGWLWGRGLGAGSHCVGADCRALVAKALRPSLEGSGDLILLVHNLTGFWPGDILQGEVER